MKTILISPRGPGRARRPAASARPRSPRRGPRPPGDTIVEVEGDAANGFGIHHYDGSEEFPPTDSEARAECSEYDARVDRVRCRVEVRTWYRDLADLQQALDWAHDAVSLP